MTATCAAVVEQEDVAHYCIACFLLACVLACVLVVSAEVRLTSRASDLHVCIPIHATLYKVDMQHLLGSLLA